MSLPLYLAMAATSLSPRPERLITIRSSLERVGAISIAWATAWELSMAGMMPSVLERYSNAFTAWSSVTATYCALSSDFR